MYISDLTLTNYKSFKTQKSLNLSKNITIITGPNGSGKSNLISAIKTIFSPTTLSTIEKTHLLNEGTILSKTKAELEIKLKENDRFPFKDEFSIKRTFDISTDLYQINDQNITKDEMHGLFDSVNLNSNFIIQQGQITKIMFLTDQERLEMIKEIAGATIYENDRKKSFEMLNESMRNLEKVKDILKNVNFKIDALKVEKEKLKEFERIENEKRKIEVVIYAREKEKIEKEIENFNDDVSCESNDFDDEIIEIEKKIKKVKNELKEINFENRVDFRENIIDKDNNVEDGAIDAQELLLVEKLKNERKLSEEKLISLKKSFEKNKINIEGLKAEFDFGKKIQRSEININEELKNTKERLNEIRNLKDKPKKSQIDYFKELEKLIEERNKLWREEKSLENKRKVLFEEYVGLERMLYTVGGSSFLTFQEIKNKSGVHGCVFELIKIPEELYQALEAVAGGSLFNVVVENDEIATDLSKNLKSRITFIPLNRIKDNKMEIEIENAILLSSKIKCKKIYEPILSYITKNSFLVSDIKSGMLISKGNNVNIVTLEGDFLSKKGSITGGYENKNWLREIKSKEEELRICDKRKMDVKTNLLKLEDEIKKIKINSATINTSEQVYDEFAIKGEMQFLEKKINLLQTNQIQKIINALPKTNNLIKDFEMKEINLNKEIKNNEIKCDELNFKIKNIETKIIEKENYKNFKNKKNELLRLNEKLDELKCKNEKENLKNLQNIKLKDFDKEKEKMNKRILIEKKMYLTKKIGLETNKDSKYNQLDTKELYKSLKEVNDKLKKFSNVNRKAVLQYDEYIIQKESLNERMDELKDARVKIEEFIAELDVKKEESVNLTFSMIKDNFKFYFSKLSNGVAELILTENGISVKLNNEIHFNLNNLSGGQKTLLALSLIFGIQRIDPSPFYFFDEIDANLDETSRLKVAELIKEISRNGIQFFICTFRKEMVDIGDRFFKVGFSNGRSDVEEVQKEIAYEFVNDEVKIE